jgi:hypothetical protein
VEQISAALENAPEGETAIKAFARSTFRAAHAGAIQDAPV